MKPAIVRRCEEASRANGNNVDFRLQQFLPDIGMSRFAGDRYEGTSFDVTFVRTRQNWMT